MILDHFCYAEINSVSIIYISVGHTLSSEYIAIG